MPLEKSFPQQIIDFLAAGLNLSVGSSPLDESNPMPVEIVGGGNDLSVLIIEDSTGTKYIRREVIDEAGAATISYENFDGTPATPIAPITVASTVLPVGASTSAKQDELRGAQGTGASYNPPTGGSGVFGWLSGINKELVSGIKLKHDGSDVSASNPLPTVLAASENHIGETGGRTVRNAATFARPADTTAYAALDTVSTSTSAPVVITFSNMARINAGSGYITKARIMTDQKTNTARYRLHLYHTAPALTNDNVAFPLLWANRANRVGKIDFSPMTTEDPTNSTCAESMNDSVRLSFTCEAANTALYGILETLDAFTPANAQNFYISLTAEQN